VNGSSDEGTRGKDKYGNDNKGKSEWEDYAIRSMAETRAISKTLRIAIGWIMKLANYEPIPFEEVTEEMMEDTVKNGNGEVDEKATEMANALEDKLKMGVTEFKKKVCDISNEDFVNTKDTQLITKIRNELFSYWSKGGEIKKVEFKSKK
jgi:hypothetical protein